MKRRDEENERLPVVQFVSKPMVPPFQDGSKCLVRDLCLHLEGVVPHVLGRGDAATELGQTAVSHDVYRAVGGFSPGLRQNLQAATWMLTKSRADLWHFVFAPNPRSSQVGAWLKRLRGVPTVQTVASPPKSFERPGQLLFGDVVVAQSAWTLNQFRSAYGDAAPPQLVEIPPPAPRVEPVSEARRLAARAELAVGESDPLFLYPGDLEVSQGAAKVVAWASELQSRVPGAKTVVAYRDKTPQAVNRASELAAQSDLRCVLFHKNVSDIHALVATSTAILFPVEDLYGKVDLPIVLLEAFRLKTPVLALNSGTLTSLHGALLLPDESRDWLSVAQKIALDSEFRRERVLAGEAALQSHFDPELVALRYQRIYEQLLSGDAA